VQRCSCCNDGCKSANDDGRKSANNDGRKSVDDDEDEGKKSDNNNDDGKATNDVGLARGVDGPHIKTRQGGAGLLGSRWR
jgi:hypothetical protein